jgi:hypothetical protein
MKQNANFSISNSVAISIVMVFVIFGAGLAAAIILSGQNGTTQTSTTSTSSSSQNIDGVVTGFVTVGPSQPVCSQNQSCMVNISGYSLEFSLLCPESTLGGSASTACQPLNYSVQISPTGHYAALLPAGNYSITGLAPSCNWVGCSSAFPETIMVKGGMQLVVNINIDTGIRQP